MCYTAFNARLELRLKGEKMKTDVQSLREIVDQAVTTDYPVLEDISNFFSIILSWGEKSLNLKVSLQSARRPWFSNFLPR